METDPTNTCNADTDSLKAYGYIQSSNVLVWGDGGNATEFNMKGKVLRSERIFKLEHKVAIRELEDKELKTALEEMNKQKDLNQTR